MSDAPTSPSLRSSSALSSHTYNRSSQLDTTTTGSVWEIRLAIFPSFFFNRCITAFKTINATRKKRNRARTWENGSSYVREFSLIANTCLALYDRKTVFPKIRNNLSLLLSSYPPDYRIPPQTTLNSRSTRVSHSWSFHTPTIIRPNRHIALLSPQSGRLHPKMHTGHLHLPSTPTTPPRERLHSRRVL